MRAWLCAALGCVALAQAPARAAAVWCAVQDGEVAYVSDIRGPEASSPEAVHSLASRFVRVVNASKGIHATLDGSACRRFADHGAATRGFAIFRNRVEQLGGRVEFIGAY